MEVHHHSHEHGKKSWRTYLFEFFMLFYDQQLYFIQRIRGREDMLIERIFDSLNEMFDSSIFDEMSMYDIEFRRPPGNPRLKKKDRSSIDKFLGDIHFLKQ